MIQPSLGAREPLPLTIVRPGHVAVAQGGIGTGVSVVERGHLWVAMVAPDGRRLLVDLLGPGDAVGMPEGVEAPCEIRAAGPVRLRPVHGHAAQTVLAARHRRDVAIALDLATLDAGARIEGRLVDLAARVGTPVRDGTRIPLVLTQDDLAALSATSRETVCRVLRRLARDDRIAVERRGRYVVRQQLRLVGG